MKSRRLAAIAAAFALFASYGAYSPGVAAAAERVLSGELVVLKGTTRQFRLVDNDGTYTAPSGMSLEDYDGKAVRVTVDNGRVTSIEPQNLDIKGVEHSTATVQGQLVVGDAVNRTFTIAGDPKVYVAPSAMDIRPFNGRMVQVRLDDNGQVAAVDPVGLPAGPALSAPVTSGCSYGGQNYSEGSAVCQAGSQFRCEQGVWRNSGTACGAGVGAPCESDGLDYADGSSRCVRNVSFLCEHGQWRNVGTYCRADSIATSKAQSCLLGGATLANGSFICRDGQTMRCSSGAWVSVGKACS